MVPSKEMHTTPSKEWHEFVQGYQAALGLVLFPTLANTQVAVVFLMFYTPSVTSRLVIRPRLR